MLAGLNITLIVSGSIAAYKSPELVRELVKGGASVRVVMTKGAMEFITPLTLQTVSRHAVTTDLLDPAQEAEIGHIALADSADVVVVAPASANIIAKMANGMADDAATAVLLATKAPVVVAPAMNVNMWEHQATKQNVATLLERGVSIVSPDEGELACGWHGPGRLAEITKIVASIERAGTKQDLKGVSVIVTAGPTREAIDPIRYITNRSSGKMGYAIAKVAALHGADVTLISGPTALTPPHGVRTIRVETAVEMGEVVRRTVRERPRGEAKQLLTYVFMVCAVMDYRPLNFSASKMKHDKGKKFALEMIPNEDILRLLGENRSEIEKETGRILKLIGFNAETGDVEDLLRAARGKLQEKRIDMIAANLAEDAFEKDTNRVWLLDSYGAQAEVATADKEKIAEKILSSALRL